nr:MAG TPA: hypothetical protein [Bacteriophage sp.]
MLASLVFLKPKILECFRPFMELRIVSSSQERIPRLSEPVRIEI